jgi:hypothetical protein
MTYFLASASQYVVFCVAGVEDISFTGDILADNTGIDLFKKIFVFVIGIYSKKCSFKFN